MRAEVRETPTMAFLIYVGNPPPKPASEDDRKGSVYRIFSVMQRKKQNAKVKDGSMVN